MNGQRLMAQAIGALLSGVMGFELLAVCEQPSAALERVRLHPPDLLVLDLLWCGSDWIAVVDAFLWGNPSGHVVLLNNDGNAFEQHPGLAQCTVGVLDNRAGWAEFLALLSQFQQNQGAPGTFAQVGFLAALTGMNRLPQRERRMLLALGLGLKNKQIALNLGLTPATVGTYRKNIAAKLGLSGAELVSNAALYRCWSWLCSNESHPGC